MRQTRHTGDVLRLAAYSVGSVRSQRVNCCGGRALPTPRGIVIEGAGIEGIPVAETTLE